jgi:hypothetical protein
MNFFDALREFRIRFYLRLLVWGDRVRKYAWARSTALIQSRRPEFIRQMEVKKGLV